MRFHVLGLPQAGTTRAYYVCGFIPAIVHFCRMMKDLGHEVILYGHEENEATVDEHVAVISKKESERYLGGVHFVAAPFESQCGLWAMTNRRMSDEIGKRKRPGDLVALLGGSSQEAAIAVRHNKAFAFAKDIVTA